VINFAHSKEVVCSKDNYLVEVEMKHLQYDKSDKPYYDRVYRPFPEEWSLAFPGLGKLRVKAASKVPPAEEVKLEYQSLKGELLATKELKLSTSSQEKSFLTTNTDLDVELNKFFDKAKEGKVRLSFVANKKTICSLSIGILGILEQTD
jgi:hypothetical protein